MSEIRIAGYLDKFKRIQLQRHVPPGKLGEFVLVDLNKRINTTLSESQAHSLFDSIPLAQLERFWVKRFWSQK